MTITGSQLVSEVESLAKGADDRYVYGGTTSAGYDCSGLIYEALLKLGYKNPPRTSEAQWQWIKSNNSTVDKSQLEVGDLVFAQFLGDNTSPGHVGIYIGNGQVYSAQDQQLGIGTASLASWGSNIVGYGRVPNSTESPDTSNSGGISGIVGDIFPSSITGAFSDLDTFITKITWLASPGNWLRIGAGFAGLILLFIGVYLLARSSGIEGPSTIPVPIPV